MAQVEKLEANIETKSPAETFFKLLKSKTYIPKACSHVQSIEVHEGDWETPGFVKLWNITLDGKPEIVKERIEVDEANKTVTFVGIEGHFKDLYKTVKSIIKVQSGLAELTTEYEKLNENVPAPNNHLQLLSNMTVMHIKSRVISRLHDLFL